MITQKDALAATMGQKPMLEIIPEYILQNIDNSIRTCVMCKRFQCDLVVDKPFVPAITKLLDELGYTVTPGSLPAENNQALLIVTWSSVIIPIMQ